MAQMDNKQYAYFLKRLREARYAVLEDAENFTDICFVLEEIGLVLYQEKKLGLHHYKDKLISLIGHQKLKQTAFKAYFDKLVQVRNEKSHQGVYSRNAAQYAVKISIILEEYFMSNLTELRHIMIDNVIFAEENMSLAKIRELMLRYSFSYLPYKSDGQYYLLSDSYIAQLWHKSKNDNEKYVNEIRNLIKLDKLDKIKLYEFNKQFNDKFEIPDKPILIYQNNQDNIVGILTPFDFL